MPLHLQAVALVILNIALQKLYSTSVIDFTQKLSHKTAVAHQASKG